MLSKPFEKTQIFHGAFLFQLIPISAGVDLDSKFLSLNISFTNKYNVQYIIGHGLQCYDCKIGQHCYDDGDDVYGQETITCQTNNSVCYIATRG